MPYNNEWTILIGVVAIVAIVWAVRAVLKRRRSMSQDEHLSGGETHASGLRNQLEGNGHQAPDGSHAVATASRAPQTGRKQAKSWENRKLFTSKSIQSTFVADGIPDVHAEEIDPKRSKNLVFRGMTPILADMLPESDERRNTIRSELTTAGYFQPSAITNLAAIRYLAIIIPMLVLGGLLVIVPTQFEGFVIAMLVAIPALGWALPRLYVRGKGRARKSEIERGMPDLLDMLNMCVSQGLTVQKSLNRISRDFRGVYPALSEELGIVCRQADVGTLEQALLGFNERIDIPEVNSFTSLIVQTERMGTSISDALTEYSDTMRESLRQQADAKANQASFKLLFPTVTCLMPAVYIFLLGPAIVELSEFFTNQAPTLLNNGPNTIQQATALPGQVNTPIDRTFPGNN